MLKTFKIRELSSRVCCLWNILFFIHVFSVSVSFLTTTGIVRKGISLFRRSLVTVVINAIKNLQKLKIKLAGTKELLNVAIK